MIYQQMLVQEEKPITKHLPFFETVNIYGRVPDFDKSESLFIGYSVRNRNFSRIFFRNAALLCKQKFSKLDIAIFDVPYAYNEAAFLGLKGPTIQLLNKARKIGDERVRMVHNVLNQETDLIWNIHRWNDFQTNQVIDLRTEMIEALNKYPELKLSLTKNSIEWLNIKRTIPPENFLGFQIQELPVLIYLYYIKNFLVDLYPGNYFRFFFELESGVWRQQLPKATELAAVRNLSFITVT